ncbi:MAG TPA: DUF3795 domain-containing protein [Methanolinea sp.]|jgi:hypothetical protein|nr:MAG: hypothetical protein A4E36_01065 [Methanoregulaceae archaeon PtaB.Bin009]HII76079.1 DUF3795 domain-containing protein [Methanolinea sp.]HNQ29515.1 DUF3795 domain-containing protein [Methanolinea sp.]
MAAKNPFQTTLIAPCGMDCAICMAYLREKNHCDGCYSANCSCRRYCTIATCEHVRDRYRHTCEKYPCRRLTQLDKRYRTKYGMSMVENLNTIREHGIRAFVRIERERWTCKECGGVINVHTSRCASCGKERDDHNNFN